MSEFTKKFNREFTMDILRAMPEKKKERLLNVLSYNSYLTSYFGMNWQEVDVYKEGWYIRFTATRRKFNLWVRDEDGKLVFGERKPREEEISFLHTYILDFTESDFANLYGYM